MNVFNDSVEVLALRDELQWLQQCLDASECGRKQLLRTAKQQQQRIAQLEAAVENAGQVAAAQAERHWKQQLQQKEREWMQEYDGQMQSLLRIIRHHERTHKQMKKELVDARGAVREKASSATQTDLFEGYRDEDVCGVAQGAIDYRPCGHECALHNVEDDSGRYGHPDVVQVRWLAQRQPLRPCLTNSLC